MELPSLPQPHRYHSFFIFMSIETLFYPSHLPPYAYGATQIIIRNQPDASEYPINIILYRCEQCDTKAPPQLSLPRPLPSQITHLIIHASFNSSLLALPHSLSHIAFGNDFNQPVDNLPPNLKQLFFGTSFNRPVDHLPPPPS